MHKTNLSLRSISFNLSFSTSFLSRASLSSISRSLAAVSTGLAPPNIDEPAPFDFAGAVVVEAAGAAVWSIGLDRFCRTSFLRSLGGSVERSVLASLSNPIF